MDKRFYFFALAKTGEGISGSDRIFIELAKIWGNKFPLTIYISHEGHRLITRQKLKGKRLKIEPINNKRFEKSFLINYLYKIVIGIKLGLTLKLTTNYPLPATILYPASDFWMDFFPALILKLRYPQTKLTATWYQTAPNPLRGYKEEGIRKKGYLVSVFIYWFSQLIAKPLISRFADKVIVNNEDEKKQFPKHTKSGNTIVLLGAVPLEDINKYLTNHRSPVTDHCFDAVFQGRFHPQKGVVELIDIWKMVVEKKPDAKLAMIGDGPLMKRVKLKVKSEKLEENIKLFGYLFDGPKKYSIFSRSKIVVHPAFYDSGGMAAAEAMAFGLPAVGFNLKAYESYYPRGMVKVKIGDLSEFAEQMIKLLENSSERKELGLTAKKMIYKSWSWSSRAEELFRKIVP